MQNQLRKAIRLAKKTGDKIMVFESPESIDAYVLMPFEDYEKMVEIDTNTRGLTEIELIDKINRDIAIWKSDQEVDQEYDFSDENSIGRVNNIPRSPEHISELIKKKQKNGGWNIPSQRKEKATGIEE